MVTEARLFDSSEQTIRAFRRLEAVGFLPEQIGAGSRLVMVVTEEPMAALAREILEGIAADECARCAG